VIHLLVDRDPEVVALSDPEVEARWLARVQCLAERGDVESQVNLAVAYRDGSDGPPQDYAKAAHWFRLAAEQADPMAQYNLAIMYHEGTGVARDLVQAYVWYNLAASGFDWKHLTRPSALAGRDRVAAQLSAAEIEYAQRMASEWWTARNRSRE
jgi:uncharacterized protein